MKDMRLYLYKTHATSLLLGIGLVALFGTGMDRLLVEQKRQFYPVLQLDLQETADESYRGRYSDDPRLLKLTELIEQKKQLAEEQVVERTGIYPRSNLHFLVRIKDYPLHSRVGATNKIVRTEAGEVVYINLSAEQLVSGAMDLQPSLVHEFTHAMMRLNMSDEEYYSVPKWFREGLALWSARQLTEQVIQEILINLNTGADPISGCVNFLDFQNESDSNLLDALLFEFLETKFGKASVRSVIAEVVLGTNPEKAFEIVTKTKFSSLLSTRTQFVSSYCTKVGLGSGATEFAAAHWRYLQGDVAGALRQLLFLVQEENKDHLINMLTWYWIGRLSFGLGEYKLAANAFAKLLNPKNNLMIGLADDSLLYLAKCFFYLQEHEKAKDLLLGLLLEEQKTPRLRFYGSEASFWLGRVLFDQGDYVSAVSRLRSAAQKGSFFAEDALYYLSLAHQKAKEDFNSKLAYSELAYRFPRSNWLPALKSELFKKANVVKGRCCQKTTDSQ